MSQSEVMNFQIGDRVQEQDGQHRTGTVLAVSGAGVQVVFDAKKDEVPAREILRRHELKKVAK